VDRIPVGNGKRGPVTAAIQARFFDLIHGSRRIPFMASFHLTRRRRAAASGARDKMGIRRKARELVLQGMYAWEMNRDRFDSLIESFSAELPGDPETAEFAARSCGKRCGTRRTWTGISVRRPELGPGTDGADRPADPPPRTGGTSALRGDPPKVTINEASILRRSSARKTAALSSTAFSTRFSGDTSRRPHPETGRGLLADHAR